MELITKNVIAKTKLLKSDKEELTVWNEIDLENGHLITSQTLSHDGKTFLLGGKTKSSLRKILLPESTVAKLKKHRASMLKEELSQGKNTKTMNW